MNRSNKGMLGVILATFLFAVSALFMEGPLPEPKQTHETYEILAEVTDERHAAALEETYGITLLRLSRYGIATFVAPNQDVFERALTSETDAFYKNDIYETFDYTINDPRAGHQYALDMLDLYEAWPYTIGSSDIVVAVIDTGILLDNSEFTGRLSPLSYNANTGEVGLEYVIDVRGHGSMVAGVIAANQNNAYGISGAAPGVEIMVIKANNDDNNSLFSSSIIDGIYYAVENGAQIINMSFGSGAINHLMKSALEYAASEGVILIAAAGNNSNDNLFYPAAYDTTISVSSVRENRLRSYFTSYGETIDIAAPGSRILSIDHQGNFVYVDGTSFASPYAAAVVALILSHFPDISKEQAIERLLFTSVEEGAYGKDIYYGYGIINAHYALDAELISVHFETYEGTEIPSIKVRQGVPFGISFAPDRDYYFFDGWYFDEGFTEPFIQRGQGIDQPLTLYAKYVEGPPPPLQSESFVYEIRDMGVHILSYIGTNSTITVPETLDDHPVIVIEKEAFANRNHLQEVYLPRTLIRVEDSAFSRSENLRLVHFADSDDPYQILDLGIALFSGCYALEDLRLPNTLMILTRIFGAGTSGFLMPSLTTLTIPARVESIESRVFYHTEHLQVVNIEEGSLLQRIKFQAFFSSGIYHINLEEATKLRTIEENAFALNNLSNITFNAPLREIELNAFRDNALSQVVFQQSVQTIGARAFRNNQITTLQFHETIETIANNAFENNAIHELTFPNGLLSIGDEAFLNNPLMGNLHLPATLLSIGDKAFYANHNQLHVTIPAIEIVGQNAFGGSMDTVIMTPLETIPPEWNPLWNEQGNSVILNTETLNETTEFIYVKTFDHRVYILATHPTNQSTQVTIPATLDGHLVYGIVNGAFRNHPYIQNVHIEANITMLEQALFAGALHLETITFAAHVPLETIKAYAFYETALSNFFFMETLRTISEKAFAYTNLTHVFLNQELETIGLHAFYPSLDHSLRIYYELATIPPTFDPNWYGGETSLITDYRNQWYTVDFYDDDGTTLLRTETIKHGETAGVNFVPFKPHDDRYDYTFNTWAPSVESVIEDMDVLAVYDATDRYFDVTFLDHEGNIIAIESVQYGNDATMVTLNPITGYHFTGWDKSLETITEDTLLSPLYEPNVYTITFIVNDDIYTTRELTYGSPLINWPNVPLHDGEEGIWDRQDIPFVNQDMTITARYGGTVLTLTFVADGQEITVRQIFIGEHLTEIPSVPEREFHTAIWSVTDFHLLEEGTTIEAVYEIFTYTVVFKNDDGAYLTTLTVTHGASADPEIEPSKEASELYFYLFDGWDQALESITEDTTVFATYRSIAKAYTVIFYDSDGTLLKEEVVAYLDAATPPLDPTKEATKEFTYLFDGWDQAFDAVTDDLIITATYQAMINHYTVTFYAFDGVTVLKVSTVPYGANATPPSAPSALVISDTVHRFTEWEPSLEEITDDINVTANYEIVPLDEIITLAPSVDTVQEDTLWIDRGISSQLEGTTTITTGHVDTRTPGIYPITYTLSYQGEVIFERLRIVTVVVAPPEIIITLSPGISTLIQGQTYHEAGATTNIGNITTVGIVNTDVPSSYQILYEVTYTDPNTLETYSAYKIRYVTVLSANNTQAMHYKTFAKDDRKARWVS